MDSKTIFFIIIFLLVAPTKSYGQKSLLPIDSLYMHSIERFYEFAEEHNDAIWPDMELSPVTLYRTGGPAFLYKHPKPPESFSKISDDLYMGLQSDLQLFADTITEINGILTAVVNYGRTNYGTVDEVMATLFHELHHAYQRMEFGDLNSGNTATGITYPENPGNDVLKQFEHRLLYEMSFTEDDRTFREFLNQFYSSRLKREELIGDYTDFERSIESFEGPAYYSEYQFHKRFSDQPESIKTNYYQNHFWEPLVSPYYGRDNLRLRHLSAGFAMCYLLDKYTTDWKKEYYQSKKSLFDFFVSKFKPVQSGLPDLEAQYAKSKFHIENQIADRKTELQRFNDQPGIKIILDFQSIPQFRGFDPVNAIAIDNSIILHKTFLRLGNDDNQLFIENKDVITLVEDQIFSVDKVIIFVPDRAIDLQDDKIIIKDDGVKIQWSGAVTDSEENMIIVEGE